MKFSVAVKHNITGINSDATVTTTKKEEKTLLLHFSEFRDIAGKSRECHFDSFLDAIFP